MCPNIRCDGRYIHFCNKVGKALSKPQNPSSTVFHVLKSRFNRECKHNVFCVRGQAKSNTCVLKSYSNRKCKHNTYFAYEAKQKANMHHLYARRKSPAPGPPPSPSSSPTPTPTAGARGGLATTDDDVEAGPWASARRGQASPWTALG